MTNFEELIHGLAAAEVRFVLVGGFAGTILGSSRITVDLDIVYARDRANLNALVRALHPLQPYLRGAPPGLPFVFDLATLERGLNFTLTTALGDLDLLGEVTGSGTYETLIDNAGTARVFNTQIRVASLRQLLQMKRAAGRPKDLEDIAELEILIDEQSRT